MEVRLNKKQKVTISGAEDIYLIMRQILRRENKIGQGQEHFWMVGLNQANKIRLVPVDNSLIFINFMNRLRAKRTDSLTNRFFLLSIRPV